MDADDLLAYARTAYGLDADAPASLTAAARGALGQIWRLEVGPDVYALKESFAFEDGELTPEVVALEVSIARRAAAAGVRTPALHPDRAGRHLLPHPAGAGWLRLYDWVDLRPVDPAAQGTPPLLGELFARLHRCAPPADREPAGGAPDPWFERPPPDTAWPPIVAAARAAGAGWAARLAERVAGMPALHAFVGPAPVPADPAALLLCHRDLHPENVFAGADGALVVVDWDNLGPAEPQRELAARLLDWFFDDGVADLDAMRRTYAAYLAAGGPARITGPADFTMLVATRLNFLLVQVEAALDPGTEPRHRDWAEREIDEALRIQPDPRHLAAALSALAAL
jgi:Ser/Thr protein kinase RdoA (MazF antagonist)